MSRKQPTTFNHFPEQLRNAALNAVHATNDFCEILYMDRTNKEYKKMIKNSYIIVRLVEVDLLGLWNKHAESWMQHHHLLDVVDGVLTKSQKPCHHLDTQPLRQQSNARSVSPPGEHSQHDKPKPKPSKSHSKIRTHKDHIASTENVSISDKKPNQIKKESGLEPAQQIELVWKLDAISKFTNFLDQTTTNDTCSDTQPSVSPPISLTTAALPLSPNDLAVGSLPHVLFSTSEDSPTTVSGEKWQLKSCIKKAALNTPSLYPELNVETAITDTRLAKESCVSTLVNQPEKFTHAADLATDLEDLQLENAPGVEDEIGSVKKNKKTKKRRHQGCLNSTEDAIPVIVKHVIQTVSNSINTSLKRVDGIS